MPVSTAGPTYDRQPKFVKVVVRNAHNTTTRFREASAPLVNPNVVALIHLASDFHATTNTRQSKAVVNKYAK